MADEPSKPPEANQDEPGPNGGDGKASKIHVDADWKREAQQEKERLVREADQAAAAAAEAGEGVEVPEASFEVLVQQLAAQAALFLSDQQDPQTGEGLQRLDLAKHTIDLLGVLEEKTRGNLDDQEQRLLDTMLYELRMAYVSTAS